MKVCISTFKIYVFEKTDHWIPPYDKGPTIVGGGGEGEGKGGGGQFLNENGMFPVIFACSNQGLN